MFSRTSGLSLIRSREIEDHRHQVRHDEAADHDAGVHELGVARVDRRALLRLHHHHPIADDHAQRDQHPEEVNRQAADIEEVPAKVEESSLHGTLGGSRAPRDGGRARRARSSLRDRSRDPGERSRAPRRGRASRACLAPTRSPRDPAGSRHPLPQGGDDVALAVGVVAGADHGGRIRRGGSPWRAPRPCGRRTPSGGAKRATARCLGDGRRYWPSVRMSTPISRSSPRTWRTSLSSSPRPSISPVLVMAPRALAWRRMAYDRA